MWVQSSEDDQLPISCDTCKIMIREEEYSRHWPACKARGDPNQQRRQEEMPSFSSNVEGAENLFDQEYGEEEDETKTFICQNCWNCFPLTVLEEHLQTCRPRQIELICLFCNSTVTQEELDMHAEICQRPNLMNGMNAGQHVPIRIDAQQGNLNARMMPIPNIANNMRLDPVLDPVNDLLQNLLFPALRNMDKGIKKKDLEKFPTEKYTKETFFEQEMCLICQQEFKEGETVMKIVCSHIFHEKCCKQWLIRENKCPLCKTVIEPNKKQPQPVSQPKLMQRNPAQ